MNSPADAFRRAARHSPLFKTFALFRQATGAHGRPEPGLYDWLSDARGALHWRDADKFGKGELTGAGDGVLTMYTDLQGIPDAAQDSEGNWYVVASGLERDGLGASLRLAVRRWTEPELPTVRAGAP